MKVQILQAQLQDYWVRISEDMKYQFYKLLKSLLNISIWEPPT